MCQSFCNIPFIKPCLLFHHIDFCNFHHQITYYIVDELVIFKQHQEWSYSNNTVIEISLGPVTQTSLRPLMRPARPSQRTRARVRHIPPAPPRTPQQRVKQHKELCLSRLKYFCHELKLFIFPHLL